MILPFANSADGFNLNRYSLFQPTILLLGIIFALAIAALSKLLNQMGLNKYYYPGSIAGVIILGFLVLKVAAPQFMGTFISTLFTYLFPRVGGASTVAELSPIFANNGIDANFPGIISQLSPFYFAVLGLALLIYRYVRKEKPGDLLVIVWSLFILIITIDANRSAYYFAVNVAILCAYLSIELVDLARMSREMRIEHIILGILLPTLLLFIVFSIFQAPNMLLILLSTIVLPVAVMLLVFDLMKRPLTRNLEISLILLISTMLFIFPSMPSSIAEAKYTSGPTPDWYTSCVWLMNNTPSPGMDIYTIYPRPPNGQQYHYPDTAYGVMSWWDYGHMMETIGHRMPNANPFQEGIGNATAGIPGSSPYFLAENESDAEKVLTNLDKNRSIYLTTRYVMPDIEMAISKFYAMTAWSDIPFSNIRRGSVPRTRNSTRAHSALPAGLLQDYGR